MVFLGGRLWFGIGRRVMDFRWWLGWESGWERGGVLAMFKSLDGSCVLGRAAEI